MGICKDAAVTYLNALGYNVVRHPRAGIAPLMLIGQQNRDCAVLGDIRQLLTNAPEQRPEVLTDQPAAAINGQRSSELKLGIGLNILGSLIGAMGGNLGVDVAYEGAKKLSFKFANVTSDSAKPLDIGNYLKNGDVDADNLVLQQYVMGNGELYLVTEVVRSNEFSVIATKSNGGALTVDVPLVQEIVGGKIAVSATIAAELGVIYKGESKLAFGFKCLRVGVENGELSLVAAAPGTVHALLAGQPEADGVVLETGLLGLGE